ncbi:hypothetical protein [Sphingomonas sp.]|jgi:hypothetical protein|uniref:hypothetical protein n=1 Tax=Sphingomonas sp. TaxID=28214 RepID=UPI002D7FA957|nr:hypothetical protein [Sphingomonas sp.]HEU0043616.1 hypothetical protein [Sphingomonas sp.]
MSVDPARHLLRALRRSAAAACCEIVLAHEALDPWSSVTFVGARHRVVVRGTGMASWLAELPELDLPMSGCFVAGCDVEWAEDGAVLTILVLEE